MPYVTRPAYGRETRLSTARLLAFGCGFVATALARRLARRGIATTGTTRTSASAKDLEKAGIAIRRHTTTRRHHSKTVNCYCYPPPEEEEGVAAVVVVVTVSLVGAVAESVSHTPRV